LSNIIFQDNCENKENKKKDYYINILLSQVHNQAVEINQTKSLHKGQFNIN